MDEGFVEIEDESLWEMKGSLLLQRRRTRDLDWLRDWFWRCWMQTDKAQDGVPCGLETVPDEEKDANEENLVDDGVEMDL